MEEIEVKEEKKEVIKEEKMAENGNGKSNFTAVAQLASTGVLLLGMFGLWWQQADPRARLDKIEANQIDNRKELSEIIAGLRKDFSTNYLSIREHIDLQNRIKDEVANLEKKIESLLSKPEFEAWRTERDKLIELMQKHDVVLDNDLRDLKATLVTRNESMGRWAGFEKQDVEINNRLEILTSQIDKIRDNVLQLSQRNNGQK